MKPSKFSVLHMFLALFDLRVITEAQLAYLLRVLDVTLTSRDRINAFYQDNYRRTVREWKQLLSPYSTY